MAQIGARERAAKSPSGTEPEAFIFILFCPMKWVSLTHIVEETQRRLVISSRSHSSSVLEQEPNMGLLDCGAFALLKTCVLEPAPQISSPPTPHFLPCCAFISPPVFPQLWFLAGAPARPPIKLSSQIPPQGPQSKLGSGPLTLRCAREPWGVCLSLSDA